MQYRKMKSAGDDLSVLGFGCMRLPEKNGKIDEARATKQLRYAIDQGLNYVDTAAIYHMGASEPFLGRALADGYREADGRIRHIGFSSHSGKDEFKELVDAYPWEFCQIQLNYLDESNQAGVEGLKYASSKGLGVVIMEPLRGGNLGKRPPKEVQAIWEGSGNKWSPVEWALRWVWHFPEVNVVLSGMNEESHIEEKRSLGLFLGPATPFARP